MRLLTNLTLFLATSLYCLAPGLSFEYDDESRSSFLSRRAIDGTRGRKYYDPQEDGFFDDYGLDKGRYYGTKESTGLLDIRNNVPGEPGVDYPAYVKIPRTTFSCVDRERGYYADVEAGCQVFHVCDDGLVSSFLCPLGSIFSQRLLTCDWWSKVPCSQSHQFYNLQSHPADVFVTDGDMLRQALSETNDYQEATVNEQKISPVFVNVRRNENQLLEEHNRSGQQKNHLQQVESSSTTTTEEPDEDSRIIRIKPVAEESRHKLRGHSRSSRQGQRERPPQETSSAEPRVTTTAITISDNSTVTTLPEEDNRYTGKTQTLFKTSSQSIAAKEDSNTRVSVEASTKKGLEEGANDTKYLSEFGNHNSAYDYYDMEGKESIGLAHSHVERNLERAEKKAATTTENDGDQRNDVTTLEYIDTSTSINYEKLEFPTQQDESIQTKESIGLIHSKVQQKFQMFDNEKGTVTENPQINTEQTTEEPVKTVYEENDSTEQYPFESSTLSNSNVEFSTEITTSNTTPKVESVSTTKAPRTQEVRKISGFRINVTEKKLTEQTTLPVDEISASDYQDLLNSSNNSFTSTHLPVTTPVLEELTTILPSSVRRISDTAEESNAPQEITLTFNSSSNLLKGHDQNPVATDALTGLVSQQVNHPINFEVVKSKQINHDFSLNQNQHEINGFTPGVRTYQHIRNYHNQNYRNHKFEPLITTTLPPNNQIYQEQDLSSVAQSPEQSDGQYQNQQNESSNFKNYQLVSPTTTQEPQQTYVNYQNDKDESTDFINYHTQYEGPRNFRNPTAHNFASTTVRNYVLNEDHSVDSKNRPFEARNLNHFHNQHDQSNNFNNFGRQQNKPEDYRNYLVNYQTHHYPENFRDFQQQPQNYQSDTAVNSDNYQNSENYQTYQTQQSSEESENYKNKQINNYADYQNYDSSEELMEAPHFGDFGVRLSTKNQKANTFKINEKSKMLDDSNPHAINFGLQGKTANFLWAMTQLIKIDRLPRPFTQPTNKLSQNLNNWNNFAEPLKRGRNNIDNLNSFKQISSNNNNFNHNKTGIIDNDNVHYNANFNDNLQQTFKENNYDINVDEFAAPRVEVYDKGVQIQKESISRLNNQHNLNEPRQERILNNNPTTAITKNPLQHFSNFNIYNNQNIPVNASSFNGNHQVVPIPQSDFNEYKVDNTHVADKNLQILPNSQPIVYNVQQSTQPIDYNFRQSTPQPIDYNFQKSTPKPIDYNFQQSTPQPIDYNVQESTSEEIDYNLEHSAMPTFESTREPDLDINAPILANTQSQIINYNLHQSTVAPNKLMPPRVYYQFQQSNPTPKPVPILMNTQAVDYSFQSTTQQTVDHQSHIPNKIIQTLTNAQSVFNFRPTILPSSTKIYKNEEVKNDNYNMTKMLITTKTTVETEFIPSLSFDFGSDQGKQEYLDALEKGLVPNEDGLKRFNKDVSASMSANVETVENASNRSRKSEKSDDIIDNFKDTGEVMSEAE